MMVDPKKVFTIIFYAIKCFSKAFTYDLSNGA